MFLRDQNMKRRNTCCNCEANRKARHRRRHPRLSPPIHQRPQHLLLLVLQHQGQQAHGHDPSRCGPVSYFFSVVHLPHMPMVINTSACEHLFFIFASAGSLDGA
ncbi:uncharacterized protein BJ212DRAFT_1579355 [Suillus subaureus]|uniref:Uncharacterized protein n=1 Tax=Suillus subaureus TaxID=48587 RepID=A0A9P7E4L2_9AGAM|nr:uncharacterized protein BJ212DRAFT_1579355 [Suillus subaureus]KAG1810911.1 hypothetical protein BJ212DRAFT_1579355 [Suillus subaureus]